MAKILQCGVQTAPRWGISVIPALYLYVQMIVLPPSIVRTPGRMYLHHSKTQLKNQPSI